MSEAANRRQGGVKPEKDAADTQTSEMGESIGLKEVSPMRDHEYILTCIDSWVSGA
jgi:hypothetical protein